MQNLITNYFFENDNCPIPGIGMLSLKTTQANFNFGDKEMEAPKPYVSFEVGELDAKHFVNYIAQKNNVSTTFATEKLNDFSNTVLNLPVGKFATIDYVGKFSKDADGKVLFEQVDYPEPFLPTVKAEKIIHKNEAHSMVVGDTQTNTVAMSDYFESNPKSNTKKWWIAAIVLTALALSILSAYFFGGFEKGIFNNVNSSNATSADSTYSIKK